MGQRLERDKGLCSYFFLFLLFSYRPHLRQFSRGKQGSETAARKGRGSTFIFFPFPSSFLVSSLFFLN